MNQPRIDRVYAAMAMQQLPQLLICDPHTIAYLTGDYILPGERFLSLLLRQGKQPVLFLNRLFAAEHIPAEQIVFYDDTQRGAAIAAGYIDASLPLGVDKKLAAVFLLELQELHAASAYCNGSPLVDRIRACKDAEEAAKMAAASAINDAAMLELKQLVRGGITEKELAQALLAIYRKLGADGTSFKPIVSFGANAGDPHHEPDDTVLQKGDCVLFDIGCKKDGYCSDMTRTYYYGCVSEEDRRIYELALRANLAGEATVRPGARFCDIDSAARSIITEGGYGPNFTHRLGHSIGRECHEWGDVSSVNAESVQPGMVFSCEPGIYLPGKTGVRIEDLCLVTEDGVQILNHVSKALEILPER